MLLSAREMRSPLRPSAAACLLAAVLLLAPVAAGAAREEDPARAGAPAPAPPKADSSSPAEHDAPAGAASSLAGQLKDLYDRGSDDEVVKLAEEYLKKSPVDADIRYAAARSLIRLGSLATVVAESQQSFLKAYNHLQAARAAGPSRLEIRIALCDVLYHLKRQEALLQEIGSLLAERPGDSKTLDGVAFYAEEYLKDGQAGRAADVYGLLARAAPGSAALVANQGTALLVSGDLDGGLATLERAARMDPADADTAHNIAQALLYRGDIPAAQEWFEKTSKASPETGRFVLDLAVVKAIGSPQEALPLFEKAASVLVSEAQKSLVENLRIGFTSPALLPADLHHLAKDLRETGYPMYSLAAAEKALRADPSLVETVLLKADLCGEKRFHRRSLEAFRRAESMLAGLPEADRAPFRVRVTVGEARAMTALGEPAAALALLKTAGPPEKFPFENAEALIGLGNIAGARSLLEKVASRIEDHQQAEAARQRLEELASSLP